MGCDVCRLNFIKKIDKKNFGIATVKQKPLQLQNRTITNFYIKNMVKAKTVFIVGFY